MKTSGGMSKNAMRIRRTVISAMFLAIALALRLTVTTDLGVNGLRISPHLVFSAMPAILFGPVYGAIVEGLTDFVGFFIRPIGTGPWIPWLTLTAVLRGALQGCLWMLLRNRGQKAMQVAILVFSVLLAAAGTGSAVLYARDGFDRDFYDTVTQDGNGLCQTTLDTRMENYNFMSRMAIERSRHATIPANVLGVFITATTVTPIGAGLVGLGLLAIDFAVRKRDKKTLFTSPQHKTLPLLVTVLTSAVVVNSLNSLILHSRFAPHVPFFLYWLPRVTVAVATAIITTYLVAALVAVYHQRTKHR